MKKVNGMYAAVALAAVCVMGCQQALAECGIASTYSSGTRTANGERYDHTGVSAAHKSLPFGTRVVVRNQRTGRSITVRINDRGPFVAGRIIDLSTGAKNALRMDGLAPVCLEVVSYGNEKRGRKKPEFKLPLIEALNTAGQKAAKAVTAVASAAVGTAAAETRPAAGRHANKHYAKASGSRKRYAKASGGRSRSARASGVRKHRAHARRGKHYASRPTWRQYAGGED
jgi:rare lipoprotein A